jgi:hypothetical protein
MKVLNPQRHAFLQVRMGREEDEPETMEDVMDYSIRNRVRDYWERYQLPM